MRADSNVKPPRDAKPPQDVAPQSGYQNKVKAPHYDRSLVAEYLKQDSNRLLRNCIYADIREEDISVCVSVVPHQMLLVSRLS